MTPAPPIPRLPVFGWTAWRGARAAGTACMLDLPQRHYTTSGRAAILLALEALGVGAGDRVLLPTYHCPTMVAPADCLGALPVFYGIDASGAPDLARLDLQPLDGVRVMLAAHYFGIPQPMAAVRSWCDARGIALIEDCAHALFGRSGDRAIGAWGDVAIGSLTKFLPVNEGGCLVLNRPLPAPRLRDAGAGDQLRSAVDILDVGARHRALPGLNGAVLGGLDLLRLLRGQAGSGAGLGSGGGAGAGSTDGTSHAALAASQKDPTVTGPLTDIDDEVDLLAARPAGDFEIDTLLSHRRLTGPARWLADRLPRQRIASQRRRHYQRLHDAFGGHDALHPLLGPLPPDCAPYVFPLWVRHPDPGYAELRRLQMPVFRWDRLWPGTQVQGPDHGLRWSHHVLQLGCHQDLSDADLQRLIDTVLHLFARPRRKAGPAPTAQVPTPTSTPTLIPDGTAGVALRPIDLNPLR